MLQGNQGIQGIEGEDATDMLQAIITRDAIVVYNGTHFKEIPPSPLKNTVLIRDASYPTGYRWHPIYFEKCWGCKKVNGIKTVGICKHSTNNLCQDPEFDRSCATYYELCGRD